MSDRVAPIFVDIDPVAQLAELVAQWEALAGKTLQPAQVEQLFVNFLSYREDLVRRSIQYAAEQNLVEFATGDRLDALGVLLDAPRLPVQSAVMVVRFERAIASATVTRLIPANTVVLASSQDGDVLPFATTASGTMAIGETFIDLAARCLLPGVVGNGIPANTVLQLESAIATITAVKSVTLSANGAIAEEDERYRARLKLAPAKFSVAGSAESYRYHAFSASQQITDVAVIGPPETTRGTVAVYCLATYGVPLQSLLDVVELALTGDRVRPLTDQVLVRAPVVRSFVVGANITLFASADSASTQAAAQAAIAAYAKRVGSILGVDIVRSQIISVLSVPGVYQVSLASPLADAVLQPSEVASVTSVLNFVAVAEG